MLETEYATGGEVEHEVRTSAPRSINHPHQCITVQIFMIGGSLFFIAEFKLDMCLEDNVAQLFVEILGASILLLGFLVSVELVSSRCQSERESGFCQSAHIWPSYRPH